MESFTVSTGDTGMSWTKDDLRELTELAADLAMMVPQEGTYCASCGVVQVQEPHSYCDGCLEAILAYLEESDQEYRVRQTQRVDKAADQRYSAGCN
jgi:hypothetical protein